MDYIVRPSINNKRRFLVRKIGAQGGKSFTTVKSAVKYALRKMVDTGGQHVYVFDLQGRIASRYCLTFS